MYVWKGCINRDYNGYINIRKLFYSYINNKPRPKKYCRGYKIKDTNLSMIGQVVSCS